MPLPKPYVFIFMGLIASGKSTLAEAFATRYNFKYYNSDVERKLLAQVERTARGDGAFEAGIYTPEMTRLTYDTLIAKAKTAVEVAQAVVVDGSYGKRRERQRIKDAFAGCGTTLIFILCTVSEQTTIERLQRRALDKTAVSDGTYDIYLIQKQAFEYPKELDSTEFMTIETDGDVEQLLTTLASSLNIPPFQ